VGATPAIVISVLKMVLRKEERAEEARNAARRASSSVVWNAGGVAPPDMGVLRKEVVAALPTV
jgi:hypothetical protein